MNKQYDIILQTGKENIIETGFVFCQGDSGIILNLIIKEFDTNGTNASIVFKKSDGNVVQADIAGSNSGYSYKMRGTELQKAGKVVADIKFYDSYKNRISSTSFIFDVTSDTLNASAIVSGNYSDAIDRAIDEFSERIDNNIEDKQNQINNFVSEAQSTIDKAVNDLSEQTSNQIAIGNELLGSFELESDAAIDRVNKASEAAEGIVLGAVPVATKYIAGSVKGDGNVEIESDGDMWADPYKDKGTATGTFINFKSADDALAQINAKGKTIATPTNPDLPISPDNKLILSNSVNFDLVSCGENLFNGKLKNGRFNANGSVNGGASNIIYNDNGFTFTTTSPWYGVRTDFIPVKSNEYYTYKYEITSTTAGSDVGSYYLTEYDINKQIIKVTTLGRKQQFTFLTSTTTAYVSIDFQNETVGTTTIINFQLNIGSTTTPYTPSKEDRINIPYELGEWNDIKDGSYVNGAVEVIYDGSSDENWLLGLTNTTGKNRFRIYPKVLPIPVVDNNEVAKILCDKFKTISANASYLVTSNNSGIAIDDGNSIYIYYEPINGYTIEQFRAWLALNPIKVRYKIAKSTVTSINTYLKTFKGTTNIYTTANPQVELTATFKSQLWTDLNNQQKAIESKIDTNKRVNNLLATDPETVLAGPMGKLLQENIEAINSKISFENVAYNPTNTGKSTLREYLISLLSNTSKITGIFTCSAFTDLPRTDWGYTVEFVRSGTVFVKIYMHLSSAKNYFIREIGSDNQWMGDWIRLTNELVEEVLVDSYDAYQTIRVVKNRATKMVRFYYTRRLLVDNGATVYNLPASVAPSTDQRFYSLCEHATSGTGTGMITITANAQAVISSLDYNEQLRGTFVCEWIAKS